MIDNLYYKAIVWAKSFIDRNLWEGNEFDLCQQSPDQFWNAFLRYARVHLQGSAVMKAAMKAVLMTSSIYEDGYYFSFFMPPTAAACGLFKEARKSLKKGFHTNVSEELYSDGSPTGDYRIFVW